MAGLGGDARRKAPGKAHHVLGGGDEVDGASAELGTLVHVAPHPVRPQRAEVVVGREVVLAAQVALKAVPAVGEGHEAVHVSLAPLTSHRAALPQVYHLRSSPVAASRLPRPPSGSLPEKSCQAGRGHGKGKNIISTMTSD